MRSLTLVGAVLIVFGIAGLVFNQFSYSENKPVLDAGPIHIKAEEEHHVAIPMIAGIVAVVAGLGMIIVSRRSA
ncbi:MAG: hypothetical protein P4L57_11040 [Rhizomicrobium sp.]|nr:hypothetical protein [Rhizomicrobium sp.]